MVRSDRRREKITNKDHVGFEIPVSLQAWTKFHKGDKKNFSFEFRSFMTFVRYKEYLTTGKNLFTKDMDYDLIESFLEMMVNRIVTEDKVMVLPRKCGKLKIKKIRRDTSFFGKTFINFKTLRRQIHFTWDKGAGTLIRNQSIWQLKKSRTVKSKVRLFYYKDVKGVSTYMKILKNPKGRAGKWNQKEKSLKTSPYNL